MCARLHRSIKTLITTHWLLTFSVMLLCSVGFGLTSYNIFYFFRANITYIADNGVMGLLDGGLEQLAWLLFDGVFALGCYVVFKACEKVLAEKLIK